MGRAAGRRQRKGCCLNWGGLLFPLSTEMRDYSELEPWQCGGPDVRNDIDLAYKLWLDDDAEFLRLIDKHGLGEVFAMIGVWSARTAAVGSLIRLNGLMTSLLQSEIVLARRAASTLLNSSRAAAAQKQQRMRDVQRARAVEQKESAEREHGDMREMALQFAMDNPRASQPQIIAHLQSKGFSQARGTIARLIAGVMREAKARPLGKTDLYASALARKK